MTGYAFVPMAERLGNGANGRVASKLRGRCVRPRFEKDIFFEIPYVVSTQLAFRHDLGT